jgi:hypothetical protein
MNKLQASMRDRSAQGWREAKLYYRVGSCFKACNHCGEYDEDRKIWLSGTDVRRSYNPAWVGFTYKCWSCLATDLQVYPDATDIGKEPRILTREDKIRLKVEVRKAAQPRKERVVREDPRIAELEARIKVLKEMLA